MGFEHRDPLEILLSREKRAQAQLVKVSLRTDGVEVHIKLQTAECIFIADQIQDARTLPQKLRIIADYLERTQN